MMFALLTQFLLPYLDIWELAHVGLHGAHGLVQQLHLVVVPQEILPLIKRRIVNITLNMYEGRAWMGGFELMYMYESLLFFDDLCDLTSTMEPRSSSPAQSFS